MAKRFLALLLLAVLLVPVLFLTCRFAIGQAAKSYVNKQLGTNATDWKGIYDDFEALFDPSMSRDEVVAKLVNIDPSLAEKLPANDSFTAKERCRSAESRSTTDEYHCGEVVRLFEDVPILDSSIPLDYYFVYDQDLKFVAANRPASVE